MASEHLHRDGCSRLPLRPRFARLAPTLVLEISVIGSRTSGSTSAPKPETEQRAVAQIRALSAHVHADPRTALFLGLWLSGNPWSTFKRENPGADPPHVHNTLLYVSCSRQRARVCHGGQHAPIPKCAYAVLFENRSRLILALPPWVTQKTVWPNHDDFAHAWLCVGQICGISRFLANSGLHQAAFSPICLNSSDLSPSLGKHRDACAQTL